ncbi:glutaredoxin 3 [uncultured Rhodoblastus sp.]|uniref:glutaredoxin 3 n=1 Tax=uncultured Rhodoblastus sp. TaxID=543037 RepID=UPI0025FBF02F|nr:glutaredoxin 3 [uncultured Rhodoblastus sp.]
MPHIVIYTTATCPYCKRAKALLTKKQAAFEEIPVDSDPQKRAEMVALAGGRSTVPQIFIAGEHIGGCDELYELSYDGKLDALLAG